MRKKNTPFYKWTREGKLAKKNFGADYRGVVVFVCTCRVVKMKAYVPFCTEFSTITIEYRDVNGHVV